MKARVALVAGAALAMLGMPGPPVGPGVAQESAGGLAGIGGAVAKREANVVLVNATPTVLTWARGLRRAADLDQYAALGLNTAYLALTDVTPEQIEQVSYLGSAAEERGLLVVVALSPRPLQDEEGNSLAIDPISEAYAARVETFVGAAVEGLGAHPRLIAWSVQAVPPRDVVIDDPGFVVYLRSWYSSLSALNESWGTEFTEWDQITLGAARDIDSDLPDGIGRASVDYAYYREWAYAEVMSLWARAVRAADPGRLVLAAAVTDYRSAVGVPSDFDALVLTTYPTVAEPDWQTHNVHAVDIARRANEFAAVQTLQAGAESSQAEVVAWAALALAHGAAGVAFSSWGEITDSVDLQAAVSQIVEIIREQDCPVTPVARAAVIYEPIAGGAMMTGEGLYGYLDGVTPNSPTGLFRVARTGTRFGLLDILRSEALPLADLSQYGTLIAPMVFYLPDEAQQTLHSYVLAGGALLVDAGIGMYQAEGTTTSMPETMRATLNLRYLDLVGVREGEFETYVEYGEVYDPAVPTETTPLAPGQQEGEVFDPALTRFVQALELFMTRADVAEFLGDNFVGEAGEGLSVSGLGKGFTVYAPEFLYQVWDSTTPHFDEFHDRILSHDVDLEVIVPEGTWPGVAATFNDDWSIGVASPYGAPTSVLAHGAGNQAYIVPRGAMRLGSAAEEDRVELLFPGDPLARAFPIPVRVLPLEDGGVATLSVERYDRDGIELLVHGTWAGVRVRDGRVEIFGGEGTPVDIEVGNWNGRMSANSVYRVTIQQGPTGRFTRERELMPNPDTGSLVIRDTITQARITIEPQA